MGSVIVGIIKMPSISFVNVQKLVASVKAGMILIQELKLLVEERCICQEWSGVIDCRLGGGSGFGCSW